MSLKYKPLDVVTEETLQSLIDNEVMEMKTIEYKRELNIGTDSEKKEFLADVSSFANASGGDIIYGIEEDKEIKGKPVDLCGLDILNMDGLKLKIDGIIRDGIEPRMRIDEPKILKLTNGNSVLILRIPRSWASLHMIKFKGSSKFNSRTSAGKYPLDVSEIKAAFLASETIVERVRNFRLDRLSKCIAGETPVQILLIST